MIHIAVPRDSNIQEKEQKMRKVKVIISAKILHRTLELSIYLSKVAPLHLQSMENSNESRPSA